MTLSEELTWRGLVNQTTFESIDDINTPRTFYHGMDPSAKSLHIGNLAQLMVVKHMVKHGHRVIMLVGGATGMIGDPKQDAERELKSLDEIAVNKKAIAGQYKQVLQGESFEIVDNYDWFKGIGYLAFLREVGKHFSMTQLLDREFIKARIGEGNVGISYAEFSYGLIQGYDFLHLFRKRGATLQIGGSDQWGNMISGAQLVKKIDGADVHVWTVPLIIDKMSGKKFGKSEGNAIWLDAEMTSPYRFYQFWLNVDDAVVIDHLKIFTMLDKDRIEGLEAEQQANPSLRPAQRVLAREVTALLHGDKKTALVERATASLFDSGDAQRMSKDEINTLVHELPTAKSGDIVEIMVSTGIAASNGEARRLLSGRAISVNGTKITESQPITGPALIKKGKNVFVLVT